MRTIVLFVKVDFMNFNSHCVLRLRSERERLGFTQNDVSDICGISREMWGKYERGLAIPGGEVLASFAKAGANIQYILTGLETSGIDITDDEQELLSLFRSAPLAVKTTVLGGLIAGTEQKGNSKQSIGHVSGNAQVSGENIYNIGVKRRP